MDIIDTWDLRSISELVIFLAHIIGMLSSIDAIMETRSSQGAIAWAISLNTFPYLVVPLYWIFGGSTRFQGYVEARRSGEFEINHLGDKLLDMLHYSKLTFKSHRATYSVAEKLAKMPMTRYNDVELLINGDATFQALFDSIESARHYVLVQFYIIHDDNLGKTLKSKLIQKAKQGISVYLLYDEIGCYDLPKSYITELRNAGVSASSFPSWNVFSSPGSGMGIRKRLTNRFQLNFRNHRKIVVTDGLAAYVGGHNVGDEYIGCNPLFGCCRDTHVKIEGPAVLCVQLSFMEDWYWAARTVPELNWNPVPSKTGNTDVIVVPTGPADELETCGLLFLHAINAARKRIWITSPYFVPDAKVISALQLAALRGVDVRIMLPEKPDQVLMYFSSFSYYDEILPLEIRIYRYHPGFLHQKVMLIDEDIAAVGTANLDNRSFRLNFEIMVLFYDRMFARQIETMLEKDFSACHQVAPDELERRGFWFRLGMRAARLMSPIQ